MTDQGAGETGRVSAGDVLAQDDERSAEDWRRLGSSLRRYQVMATITGCMLLALCTEMILKYVLHMTGTIVEIGSVIAIAHGWIYVIYLVTVFLLWSNATWRFTRLAFMVIAGVIPFLSFVMEWRATTWLRAEAAAAGQSL